MNLSGNTNIQMPTNITTFWGLIYPKLINRFYESWVDITIN